MKTHHSFKKNRGVLDINFQLLKDHEELTKRFNKTLYYGKTPNIDRPSLPLTDISVKLFSKSVPSDHLGFIDMHFAAKVGRNACISPCSMMIAMVYIERLRHRNPEYIQTASSSDLFLVSMMLATKFINDEGEDDEVFNDEWAASADMEVNELNKLEREFLTAIDWDLFITPSQMTEAIHAVETRVALQEADKRGWYSYSDIDVLTRCIVLSKHWKLFKENVLKVITVCSVAYTAAICILIGSTALVSAGIGLSKCATFTSFCTQNRNSSPNTNEILPRYDQSLTVMDHHRSPHNATTTTTDGTADPSNVLSMPIAERNPSLDQNGNRKPICDKNCEFGHMNHAFVGLMSRTFNNSVLGQQQVWQGGSLSVPKFE